MSTKITLSYDKDYHLYQECFDDNNIYFRIEGFEYEINNHSATIQIPLKMWEKIISEWPEAQKRFIFEDKELNANFKERMENLFKNEEKE